MQAVRLAALEGLWTLQQQGGAAEAEGLPSQAWTLIAVTLGAVLGAALTLATSLLLHQREREARRKEALREAYADWLSACHQVMGSRAARILYNARKNDPFNLPDALLEEAANNVWKATILHDRALHRILVLEKDESYRKLLDSTDPVMPENDRHPDWDEYTRRILDPNVSGEWPPFTERMSRILERLRREKHLW